MTRHLLAGTFALACSASLLGAQTPTNPPPGTQQPRTPGATTPVTPSAPSAQAGQPATTLVGCLYRENQIPGRTPNLAERAGVLEDYILADASASGAARPGTTPGATGTTGTSASRGSMYKVENVPDEKLKSLVGKRVEVMGRIDPEGAGTSRTPGATTPDRAPGPDAINLPEFEATSIREVAAGPPCPATPASPVR